MKVIASVVYIISGRSKTRAAKRLREMLLKYEENIEVVTRSFFQQVLETVGVQESETIESNAAREMLLKYEKISKL